MILQGMPGFIPPDREQHRSLLHEAMVSALNAAHPAENLATYLLPSDHAGRTVVLAAGKAAVAMAAAAHWILGDRIEGVALTRYGHSGDLVLPKSIEVVEAAHPVPDHKGEMAARKVLDLATALTEQDRCIVLLSGGGSALLALPGHGITLADKQAIARDLLASGATVSEMNCVRKHLSAIKGGRLALAAAPARVENYIISDVAGDDPATIASGPTMADMSTLADARRILRRYGIAPPPAIARALKNPKNALPSADHPAFARSITHVIATASVALEAAARITVRAGYEPIMLGDDLEGDAAMLGALHADHAREWLRCGRRVALISGGECTVTLRNRDGQGGPNGEYLLSLILRLNGTAGVFALAIDSDGIDGTGQGAGAIVDPTTLERARAAGVDLAEALDQNNAHPAFAALGDLIITGPTLTNVNDIRIILVDPVVA